MEGSDTWAHDSQTSVHPYFNIDPSTDGGADCGPVIGAGGTYADGMSFTYSGDNNFMDRFGPGPGAFVFTRNGAPVYDNCVANDSGAWRTIGCGYEFGGLDDATSPSTKAELLAVYLDFLESGFTPTETVSAQLTCSPCSGTLPFTSQMRATMTNIDPGQIRRLAGRMDVTLASGSHFPSWRSGFTNLAGEASYVSPWGQNFPALGALIGENLFKLTVADVTPIPYNQPPYPPAGDTASATVLITGTAP